MSYRIRNGAPAEFAARAQSVAFLGSPRIPTRPQLMAPIVANWRPRRSIASPRIKSIFVARVSLGDQRERTKNNRKKTQTRPPAHQRKRRMKEMPLKYRRSEFDLCSQDSEEFGEPGG